MSKLQLTIVMPTGKIYEGEADRVLVRAALGDMAIMPGHVDIAAALGNGEARLTIDGNIRKARINGGLMHVNRDTVRILTDDFKWEDSGKYPQ